MLLWGIAIVRIFDKTYQKKAEVVYINAYSGHADMADLDNFVMNIEGLKKLILIHGEIDQMEAFAKRIQHVKSEMEIVMPEREENIVL